MKACRDRIGVALFLDLVLNIRISLIKLLEVAQLLHHLRRVTLKFDYPQIGVKRMHVISVSLMQDSDGKVGLLLRADIETFRDGIEILLHILMDLRLLEFAH